jgi:signal transduction histidine kinase
MNRLLGRRRWSIRLPKDVPAARTARAVVDQWLEGTHPATTDAARSIVTELVSNAVRFGRPPIELTVELQRACLRIEVTDGGTGTPLHRPPDKNGGWGLEIVRRLAPRHGMLEGRTGVWCELSVDRETAARPRPQRASCGPAQAILDRADAAT